MTTSLNWLDEVVLLNESKWENVAGEVSVYRSEGDALNDLEASWVEKCEGYAFTATGIRLVLAVGSWGQVIVSRREECAEGPAIVFGWMQALAQVTLEARDRESRRGWAVLSRAEEEGALPTTLEGLLAYAGLPWPAGRDWFAPGCLLLLTIIAALLGLVLIKLF